MQLPQKSDIVGIRYNAEVRFAKVIAFIQDNRLNEKILVMFLDNGEKREYDMWDRRMITELDPRDIVKWKKSSQSEP
jgi:hypothetical protein